MNYNSVLKPEHVIYVAGHNGMVGSAIVRNLKGKGFKNILTRSRAEIDLVDQSAVNKFFRNSHIDYVVLAGAKVGGINANNTYPAQFIYENIMIQNNIIHGAYKAGITRLLFLGSSCIYPKLAPQPMREDYLLTGHLEQTNEPYAVAKIAGIKMCESYNRQYGTHYRSVMPTNLYGQGDSFNIDNSHVIPALLRKAHESKLSGSDTLTVWGSGKVQRELLHVDDMADASVFIMEQDDVTYEKHISPMLSHINVGTGDEISIADLAEKICKTVGFNGDLIFNTEMPEGAPRKLLDISRLTKLGWRSKISLETGLKSTYGWFLQNQDGLRT